MVKVGQVDGVVPPRPTHRLNVIGFFCPIPVSEAKKVLKKMSTGNVLELLADDPETLHDLPMLIDRTNHTMISIDELAGEYTFLIEVNQ
ncbi:MAG: sulfurtransferase TusA family protein [Euryarchaeota archaeon]